MASVKAVVFDLDNTLYDESSFVEGGFMAVSAYINKQFGINHDEFFKFLTGSLKTYGRGRTFNIALEKYNLTDRQKIEDLIDIYRNYCLKLTPYAGTLNILQLLKKDKKMFLGLITDGLKTVQQNKVRSLGIGDLFDFIVYTDDLGNAHEKPDKLPYEMMLRHFAILPKEMVFIGDNPHKDFIGAKSIGIKTIRLLKGEYKDIKLPEEQEAHYCVDDIKQLLDVLDICS